MTILEKMRERYGKAAYEASPGVEAIVDIGGEGIETWYSLSDEEQERWRKIGDAAVNSSHNVSSFSNCTLSKGRSLSSHAHIESSSQSLDSVKASCAGV